MPAVTLLDMRFQRPAPAERRSRTEGLDQGRAADTCTRPSRPTRATPASGVPADCIADSPKTAVMAKRVLEDGKHQCSYSPPAGPA